MTTLSPQEGGGADLIRDELIELLGEILEQCVCEQKYEFFVRALSQALAPRRASPNYRPQSRPADRRFSGHVRERRAVPAQDFQTAQMSSKVVLQQLQLFVLYPAAACGGATK